MRLWPRTSAERAIAELRDEVRHLATSIDQLATIHRKHTEQLKKLRESFADRERAWETTMSEVVEKFRRGTESQRRSDVKWQRTFDRIDQRLKSEEKWRTIFKDQLSAVVRRLCLPLHLLQPPHDLVARRFRLRSQNEEDGILFALLEQTGWGARRFVEIGSGSSGGNAAVLAYECGWSGLMIDLSADAIASGRRRFAVNPLVTLVAERITPENVNDILAQHRYTGDVELVSIDIDSYDYWILEALSVCSPRILMVEYNALFGPERRVTIPRSQSVDGTPKGYGGASLPALTDLASRKGYRLVACDPMGVNAFFLRHDVAPDVPGVPVNEAYRPLLKRINLDHPEVTTDIYDLARRAGLPLVEL